MNSALFAQQQQVPNLGNWLAGNPWVVVLIVIALIVLVFFFVIFFSFLRLWIQSLLTGADISILNLVGMKLRNVDYNMIVKQKIALVQAGIKISTADMEAHYLSNG